MFHFLKSAFPLAFLVILQPFILGCHQEHKREPVFRTIESLQVPSDTVLRGSFELDSTLIDSLALRYRMLDKEISGCREFYRLRHWQSAWFGPAGLREHAGFLQQTIEQVEIEGIRDSFPALADLQSRMNMFGSGNGNSPELEALLTISFFWYANRAWGGISQKTAFGLNWFLPRPHRNATTWLEHAIHDSLVEGLFQQSVFEQYRLLRSRLVLYDSISVKGGWDKVQENVSFQLGDTSRTIQEIARSLYLHGDMSINNNGNLFDSLLLKAVLRFKKRHGLYPVGKIDSEFIEQLNVSLDVRIQQMLVNLERCRWMPYEYPQKFLFVNIPDFSLTAFDNNKPAWSMPVVVGKELHQTVSFYGEINQVVFHPYWVVPSGILYDEILPAVRRSASFLRKNNMEVVDAQGRRISESNVNWEKYKTSGFPYIIRQRPGKDNPLGKVKFLFPNNFSIYLHDSPAQHLFKSERRAYSHGCIRVGDPQKLAAYVLGSEGWDGQMLDDAFKSKKERWVELENHVPVFVVYFTSWVDEEGELNFRDDVYGRDSKLKSVLLL